MTSNEDNEDLKEEEPSVPTKESNKKRNFVFTEARKKQFEQCKEARKRAIEIRKRLKGKKDEEFKTELQMAKNATKVRKNKEEVNSNIESNEDYKEQKSSHKNKKARKSKLETKDTIPIKMKTDNRKNTKQKQRPKKVKDIHQNKSKILENTQIENSDDETEIMYSSQSEDDEQTKRKVCDYVRQKRMRKDHNEYREPVRQNIPTHNFLYL